MESPMNIFKILDGFLLSKDNADESRLVQFLMARLSRGNVLMQQGKVLTVDGLAKASNAADKAMLSLERMNAKL
jgi:hypothetical protein